MFVIPFIHDLSETYMTKNRSVINVTREMRQVLEKIERKTINIVTIEMKKHEEPKG